MRIEDGVVYFDRLVDVETGKTVSIILPTGYDPNDPEIKEYFNGLKKLAKSSAQIDIKPTSNDIPVTNEQPCKEELTKFFSNLAKHQTDDDIPKFSTSEMWDYLE